MPSDKDLKKIQAAIAVLNEISGGTLDIEMPLESIADKILQAQAAISYYDTKARDFYKRLCDECHLEFAYAYPVHTVRYCSIPCISRALEKRGLRWNPERSLEQRYGRFAPATVPPQALALMPDFTEEQESSTTGNSELDDLLSELGID